MATKFLGDKAFSGKGWFSQFTTGSGWLDQEWVETGGVQTRTIVGSGGIVFSGVAAIAHTRVIAGSGGLTFGGAAGFAGSHMREIVGSGGIAFGGAATIEHVSAAAEEPTTDYHGGGKKRHEDDYEIVVKQWELLELRRRAQAKHPEDQSAPHVAESQAPETGRPQGESAESGQGRVAPARGGALPERALSPLLKIDLDSILTRRVLDDAAGEVERYNALRAAIAEVEETELLMLMAVAAAEDDE